MSRIVRIWIDEDICLTDGFCVLECPAVFSFDDSSPYPRIAANVDRLFESQEEQIRAAVNVCPYFAIHIEEEG